MHDPAFGFLEEIRMKFFNRRTPRRYSGSTLPSQFEGEVHRRSIHHATGWARDRANPAQHLTVEAVIIDERGERVVGQVPANTYYGPLSLQSYDDVWHGFQLIFEPPLTVAESENLVIRPAGTQIQLELAARPELPVSPYDDDRLSPIEGCIDAVSLTHVVGWMVNRRDPGNALDFEVALDVLGETRIIARGRADQPYAGVEVPGAGPCGFKIEFSTPLTPDERNGLMIRVPDHDCVLTRTNSIQGYVDELDQHHAAGWVLDRFQPENMLEFEVILAGPGGEQQLATGIADNFHAGLAAGAPEHGSHGFRVNFTSPLTPDERNRLMIRVPGHDSILPRAPGIHGFVDELSPHHVAGWVRDRFRPEDGLTFEVILTSPNGEYQLATGIADNFHAGLAAGAPEDGYHGFHVNFTPPLTPEQIRTISVRVMAAPFILPFSFS